MPRVKRFGKRSKSKKPYDKNDASNSVESENRSSNSACDNLTSQSAVDTKISTTPSSSKKKLKSVELVTDNEECFNKDGNVIIDLSILNSNLLKFVTCKS